MEREDNSDLIPIDIIIEILSKSSTKSIARFGLASKFCASILRRPDFTKLFSARSTTQPRLLFAIGNSGMWRLYSAPQPHNPDENHSLVVAADFHMQFHGDITPENICGSLLHFCNTKISMEDTDSVSLICNPSTGHYARLPQLTRKSSDMISLLGYDPIGKQYKVLAISNSRFREKYILTLGTGRWRKMECSVDYFAIITKEICINGVLYFIASQRQGGPVIACFDVRYEKIWFLNKDSITRNLYFIYLPSKQLVNYKGKLGLISWDWYRCENYRPPGPMFEIKLCLWILEDAQKQEWLKRGHTLPEDIVGEGIVSVFGVTSTGEIVMSFHCISKSQFFVIYFNPERNTSKKVEIQGFEALNYRSRVYGFVDYAEDLKFI